MTWKKRIISIALCLCALLCAASVRAEAAEHSHPICGASHKDVGDHTGTCDNVTWTAWDGTDMDEEKNGVQLTDGYYYLTDNVTLQGTNPLTVPKGQTLYLCLNGHSIKIKHDGGYWAIDVEGGNLILCDCKGGGTITQDTDNRSKNRGVYVQKKYGETTPGKFTMYGGSITGNKGGVEVRDGCTFTMYGGSITQNAAGTNWGGGVYVYDGTFIVHGGTISDNSADNGGGVFVGDNGEFTMSGGSITNNTAKGDGGGVYNQNTFTMSNGEISSNTATRDGGGVYGGLTMSSGKITGNKATTGGGVEAVGDAVQITGGEITGNTATNEGGGVCFYNSNLTISSAAKVANNKAAKGGGVFFQGCTAFNMLTISDSAQITDNTAAENGGGIYISKNKNVTFLLSGSINISGNKKSVGENASTPNNVYLPSGYVITLTGELTNTQKIGVTTENTPSESCISITALCYDNKRVSAAKDKFTYENDNSYSIVTRSSGKVLAVCDHVYDTTKWSSDETNHYHKCKNCDTTKDTTAHSYSSDWKTDNSKHWHECECGQKSEEAAHSYSTAWDRDNTSHFHKCSACGDKTDIAICVYKARVTSGHQKSDATCTAKAMYWKSCVCDRESTETFEYGETNPNNHTGQLGDWQTNTDEHWKVYSCCQAKAQEGTHTWDEGKVTTPATCTTPGEKTYTCGTCNAKKTERIDATGHTEVTDAAVEATCTKTGLTEGKHCSVCNTVLVAQQTVPTKSHTEVIDAAVEATCTEPGKTEGKHCSVCNTVLVEQTTIPAKGHTEVVDAKVEATCTKTGKTEGKHCSVCNTVLVEQTTIPAKGHTEVIDAAVEATCTEPGKTEGKHCSVCNTVLVKQDTIPATGHTPGAAVRENKVAATCTTAGSYDEVVYCTACGNEVSRTQKTIDKLAHDYDTAKWVKAGENQHGHKCKNCDAITDLTAHVHGAAATETTPQLCTECGYVIAPATHPVHTWVFVAETPATCNAAGEREHYKCDCRRKSVTDGVYDIVSDTELILAINPANHTGAPDSKWHSDSANHWQEYTCCHARANEAAHSGGAATCTAQAVCQVCGKAYGPLAAHAWQPATCTAPKTCSVCHTTEGTALGHDWDAWKVTTPATKDAPGVETRTCAHNSAHTETRSIPKLSTTVYTVSEDTKIAQIEAKVDGLDKILESDENKALVNDGKSVGVSLTVKNTASSGVSEKIKEKLAGSNLVGLRLELTVEKTVTANGVVEPKQTIHDAGVLLKTTITLPAELQGKSGYVVYRLHDENVHVLTETANENGEFISVSADKTQITICARLYSEYVIAYQTGGSSGGGYHPVNPTPVKATSANTGDAGVLLYGVTAALSLTGTAWLGAKSRKH